MVRLVRGEGPLRPDKARAYGFGDNESPLFRLFQAFRRSSPKPKVAGAYAKLLAVPDNDRAREMAERFHAGDVEYQSDEKWYELIEEADRELLTEEDEGEEDDEFWGGEEEDGEEEEESEEDDAEGGQVPPRDPMAALTRKYRDELTDQRWDVHAFSVRSQDPGLGDPPSPWTLSRTTAGPWQFLVDRSHPVFRSATMTPTDALLAELAWSAMDFLRSTDTEVTFSSVLAGLRESYARRSELDPVTLNSEAIALLRSVARSAVQSLDPDEARSLFEDLAPEERRHVLSRLATAAGAEAGRLIDEGRFLEYAPYRTFLSFFEVHPELFFDGKCWDVPFGALDLGDAQVTEEAQHDTIRRYFSLLSDAVWLASQDPTDLEASGRTRLLRAMLALDLLAADMIDLTQ